jgi:hypothetical protein
MKVVILFLFITTNYAFAKVPIITDKWERILNLISEEEKTIKSVKNIGEDLHYRLFELQSERIKIWQQKENEIFMQKQTSGKRIERQQAFKETLRLYHETKQNGENIISRTKNKNLQASVYYTLALNSRDYGQDQREFAYLKQAIALSAPHTDLNYYARTSLAEYYYNNKKYPQAVHLYEQITKNQQDEWLTKNLYNYGWCLIKTQKFLPAIEKLENAYQLGKTPQYIDFSEQIVTGLTSFYVLAKEIDRGTNFIINHISKDQFQALFSFAGKIAAKGHYKETLDLIKKLPKFYDPKEKTKQIADLVLFEFDFYKQFNQKDEMYRTVDRIGQITLNDEQREDAILKLTNEVSSEQQILKKTYDSINKSYSQSSLTKVLHYFDTLIKLDRINSAQYNFYKAESLFSVAEYARSILLYKQALANYDIEKSQVDIQKKAMDGIYASIELAQFAPSKEIIELEYAYTTHLKLWPKENGSELVYEKLFSLHLAQARFNETQSTLENYYTAFPKNLSKIQELFTAQLDLIIKNEKSDLLSDKINLMAQGFLKFDDEKIKKAEQILASILFKQYQQFALNGKIDRAIEGYQKIFHTEKYPKSIKADAAFNLGIIHVDKLDTPIAIKWFEKSLPLFNQEEKKLKRNFLEKMALRASLLQDLQNAANINKIILSQYCQENPEQNFNTFAQMIQFELANDYVSKALHGYSEYKKCVKGDLAQLQLKIITHLYHFQHNTELLAFIDQEKLESIYKNEIGLIYENLYWQNFEKNINLEKLYSYRIKKLNCDTCIIFIKAYNELSSIKAKVKTFSSQIIKVNSPFEPEIFNRDLNQRITNFRPLVKEIEQLVNLGHPQFTMIAYDKLVLLIENLYFEVKNLDPNLEDKEFNQQFKTQMMMVANNIYTQKTQAIERYSKIIQDNQVFIEQHKKSLIAHEVMAISDIRNPASVKISTLDLKE